MKQKLTCLILSFLSALGGKAQLYTQPNALLHTDNGAVLTVYDADVILNNDVTGAGNGKIEMRGTANQTINSNNYSVYGLEIENNANVTMLDTLDIADELLLSQGLLVLNNQLLSLRGTLVGTGKLAGSSNSDLVLAGTSGGPLGTVTFDKTGANNHLNSLSIARSGINATATLGDTLIILNTLSATNGRLYTGGGLTLHSDNLRTARVAPISGTGDISGNVIVERYIPASGNRAWRLVSASLRSSIPTILNSWQEGSSGTNPKPGYGTNVTKPAASVSDGWDMVSNSTSLQYWDGAALATPSNTNLTKVGDNGAAWFLFVRGDKSITPTTPTASGNTTLRMAGSINQGNVINAGSISTTGPTGFSLIPNPYPSPINFEEVRISNGGINKFQIWDATANTIGAYCAIERQPNGSYQATPPTADDNSMRYIQSGQAFFVEGATPFNFSESMKTDSMPALNAYKTTSVEEELLVILKSQTTTGSTVADAFRLKFDACYDTAVTSEDIRKISNISENIGIFKSHTNLIVNRQPLPAVTDTIHLKFTNTALKNYEFHFEPSNFSSLVYAYLIDGHLATITPINLSASSTYSFNVSSTASSWNPDRFKIVFSPGSPLAAGNIHLAAFNEEDKIRLNWIVKNERGVKAYLLEKSIDGNFFGKIHEAAARANTGNDETYESVDLQPERENLYRIKMVGADNEFEYSNTVRITNTPTPSLTVFPNPVTSNAFHVRFDRLAKGNYHLEIINLQGQTLFSGRIDHDGNNNDHKILLSNMLANGNYMIRISDETGTTKCELPITLMQ